MRPLLLIGLLIAGLIIVLLTATIHDYSDDALPIWNAAVSPGPLSAAHAFLSNKCESCHTPNRGIVAAKCVTCHASSPELLMKPITAFHAHLNDCRGCHAEHQGRNVRPIHMDHVALLKMAMQYISEDHPNNITKSSPHTAHHLVQLDCQSCHAFQDKHHEFFGKDCSSCHSEKSWKIPGYVHPSPTSTNCSECHKAPPSHRMMHFEMMDKSITGKRNARVDQCYMCHQTDSFNDIKGKGWYKMH